MDNNVHRLVGIYRDTYDRTFKDISNLVKIAKIDFPNLKDSEIKIEHYGGKMIAGKMGIEFNPGNSQVPASYEIMSGHPAA